MSGVIEVNEEDPQVKGDYRDPIDAATEKETVVTDRGQFELTPFLAMAWKAGFFEPGWDVVDYLRFAIDNYGWENFPIWGIKGCLPEDTEIITDCGIKTIKEIIDHQGCYVLSDNNGKLEHNYATPFFVGIQKLFKIVTSKGIIEATAEHPFMTIMGWKTVAELTLDDKLKYINIPHNNKVSYHDLDKIMRTMQQGVSNNIQGTEVLQQVMFHNLEKQTSYLQTSYRRNEDKNQGENQSILCNTPITSFAREPSLPYMQQSFFSSPKFKNDILFPIMWNKTPQPDLWQPKQRRCCEKEEFRDKEENIFQNDKGTDNRTMSLESPLWGMDENPSRRTSPDNEGVLQSQPRVCSEKGHLSQEGPNINATQLYDSVRDEGFGSSENFGIFTYLEQGDTLQRQLCISRLPNSRQQSSDRVQWCVLASGSGQGNSKSSTIRTEWLHPNNIGGATDKTGDADYYKEATIISIIPSVSKPVYNLEVNNANNFFLANGILTHNSKKSNRMMHYLYEIYGDWFLVHRNLIMKPLEFTQLLKNSRQNPEKQFRIPMIGWDDMTAWLDSQLYFENRSLYTNIKRCWALMRTKLNVFVSSCPLKTELPGFILRDINAEMFASPKLTITYDRWTWRKNYFDPMKVVKRPINVLNFEHFDYLPKYDEEGNMVDGVPTSEFKVYWDRRMEAADTATDDLIGVLEEAFNDDPVTQEEIDVGKKVASEAARALVGMRKDRQKRST